MKERRNWKSLCRRLYRKALADCFLAEHEGSETFAGVSGDYVAFEGAFVIVMFFDEKKEDCSMFETVLDAYVAGRLGYFSVWPITSDSPNTASALYEDERKAFAGASSAPELDLRLAARGF